jgi:hypothetical protein
MIATGFSIIWTASDAASCASSRWLRRASLCKAGGPSHITRALREGVSFCNARTGTEGRLVEADWSRPMLVCVVAWLGQATIRKRASYLGDPGLQSKGKFLPRDSARPPLTQEERRTIVCGAGPPAHCGRIGAFRGTPRAPDCVEKAAQTQAGRSIAVAVIVTGSASLWMKMHESANMHPARLKRAILNPRSLPQ